MRRQGTKGTRVPNGGRPRLVLPLSSTTPDAFSYDANGNLASLQRGASAPFTFGYDALDRRTNMTDSVGTTAWRYDAMGRLVGESGPFGTPEVQVAYDPNGRLSRRVWARGVEPDYAYNALGQLTVIDYSDSTPDVAFTYDRLGRQLTVTDVLGTRTNVYDALNLLEERLPDGTTLTRSYDPYGRPFGLALGTNYAVTYAYDEHGRFSTVTVSTC